MAVVWRVQFFNDSTGKNEMGGWMLEHLKAGQVSDGWVVAAGHCQARNIIRVQVKCAVRDGEEDACFKDSNGISYPLRSTDAYRGDHKSIGSTIANLPATRSDGRTKTEMDSRSLPSHSREVANKRQLPTRLYWYCNAIEYNGSGTPLHIWINDIFEAPRDSGDEESDIPSQQIGRYGEQYRNQINPSVETSGCSGFLTMESAQQRHDMDAKPHPGLPPKQPTHWRP